MAEEKGLLRSREMCPHREVGMRRALIPQAEHDPMLTTTIRHPRMPQPQVPDHHVSAADFGLQRRAHDPARLLGRVCDPRRALAQLEVAAQLGGVRRQRLVVDGRGGVRAQPELGRAVLRGEVDERHVGDEVVGVARVREGRVLVRGLAEARGVGDGGVGCEPVPDGLVAEVACVHCVSGICSGGKMWYLMGLRIGDLQKIGVEVDIFVKQLGSVYRWPLEEVCWMGSLAHEGVDL